MEPTPESMLKVLLAIPIASLGTLHEGAPFVSMVPVVPAPDGSGFLIHVSRLAQHTRDLVADARMSLLFTAPLDEGQNPLALPRVTLIGTAQAIAPGSDEHDSAADVYLAQFPQAEQTLGLGDFSFFRLLPATGRLVLGFGRALTLDSAQIRTAWPSAR